MRKQWRLIWCLIVVASLGWVDVRVMGQAQFVPPQYPQYVQYPQGAPPAVPGPAVTLTSDQIDQLLGPIALYPDPLLSMIFPAATYPQDVVAAEQWLQATPSPTEADIAAMAPHATIGAAHPVEMGNEDETTNSIMMQKVGNAYAKVMQTIAEKRHRNVEWAKSSVTASKAITSEEALQSKVIDLIATNVPDLLQKLNGRSVNGKILKTAAASVVEMPMSPGEKFFQMFWQPEVMMLLMLIAVYGIIAEMSHPGAIFPGVAGVLALILLLYMSAKLPVNVAGVALILLAVALFIVDIFAPTHGVLTGGGIVAFFLGALMLFNHAPVGYHLPMSWIISSTLVTALFFIFVVSKGIRAQFLPKRAGAETMLGKTVNALSRIDAAGGRVFIEGEHWNAVSETPVEAGQPVTVTGIEGLTLKVKPKN